MAKKIVVVKFGGTSVSTEENRQQAFGHIKKFLNEGYAVAAVVSAMGRDGAPYATDTLLNLVPGTKDEMGRDLLASCGEVISACVFSYELNEAGVPSVPMNGFSAGIKTDGVFGSADICGMDTSKVLAALDEGKVPVITGFQGYSEDGEVTTLGRGGSDTSAVEIGGYLKAEKVVIYTDVPGIAVADPRVIPEVRYLKSVNYSDMLFLADWGAKVIHPRAVKAAEKHDIPVSVASTFEDGDGTAVVDKTPEASGLVGVTSLKHCRECDAGEVTVGGCRYVPDDGGCITIVTMLLRGRSMAEVREKYGDAEYTETSDTIRAHLAVSDDEASETIAKIYADWN